MEPGTVLTESMLVRRAAAGDSTAFGELYACYLDTIYRYIFYRVGDNRDAEDLTETTFLKAWQALPTYQDYGLKFASWLYRIAHNVIVDFHRKRISTASAEERSVLAEELLPTSLLAHIDTVEENSALAQAIAKLTEEQQQIILLRFIEGFSHAEIARIMNKTEGACRMLQTRALTALQQQLSSNE